MKAKVVKVNPSDLQSIMFEKSKWTVDKAKRWLKKHGFLRGEVDAGGERANYLRFRQFNPESGLRYRSIPLGKGKGIMASVAFTGRAPATNPRRPALREQDPRTVQRRDERSRVNKFAEEALRIAERDGWMGHDVWVNATPSQRMYAISLLAASISHKAGISMVEAEKYAGDVIACSDYRAENGHRYDARRNPSEDTKWAIGFIDSDGRNDRAVVWGTDKQDAYRNFVGSYGKLRVFSVSKMENRFWSNPGLGQGQRFRHRDYEQPIGDPQLARRAYQPKTGQPCHCRPGRERDNCPDCEGTGWRIDFRAIRARRR